MVLTPLSPASRLANERIARDLVARISKAAAKAPDYQWMGQARREIALALDAAAGPPSDVSTAFRAAALVDALDDLRDAADFTERAFALTLAALRR
jgi:hypothetical protein